MAVVSSAVVPQGHMVTLLSAGGLVEAEKKLQGDILEIGKRISEVLSGKTYTLVEEGQMGNGLTHRPLTGLQFSGTKGRVLTDGDCGFPGICYELEICHGQDRMVSIFILSHEHGPVIFTFTEGEVGIHQDLFQGCPPPINRVHTVIMTVEKEPE